MIFCLQINTKVFYKLIVSLWLCVARHAQSTLNIKFSISLQYLEREVRNGVHFLHADKHQSFYNLALSFLMEVVRHVQSTQNKRLVIFLQYIKKKVLLLLMCFIVLQNIEIFYGGPLWAEKYFWRQFVLWNYWLLLQHIFFEMQLKREKLKSVFGHQSLGAQTGLLVSQTAWIRHWCVYIY